MNLSNNTILITGGSSGIGLELATQLAALGNTIIVTGRDPEKLTEAQRKTPKLHAINCDVTDADAVAALHAKVVNEFPALNMLINNAGIMRQINFKNAPVDPLDVTREIDTNLIGPIRLIAKFLPHLQSKSSAAIMNVSSGLAFTPLPASPVYSATKAALHSFTQSLRVQLQHTQIKVFELAPPVTKTPMLSDAEAERMKAMPVEVLAAHALAGLRKDQFEIRPGAANAMYIMSRVAPGVLLRQLGKLV